LHFLSQVLRSRSGILELGLDRVGIYSSNSQWRQLTAFGASSVGLSIVPISDSLWKDAAKYIMNRIAQAYCL
jgi:long-subunit acyl-CoA synthetase (AMP-forming)